MAYQWNGVILAVLKLAKYLGILLVGVLRSGVKEKFKGRVSQVCASLGLQKKHLKGHSHMSVLRFWRQRNF